MKADFILPPIDPLCEAFPFRLICFSLGKADAFLISTPYSAVLIDTGSASCGKQLAQQLLKLKINRLDFLIITHFDSDHIGGIGHILKSIQVDQLLQSPLFPRNKDSHQYRSTLKKYNIRPDSVQTTEQFLLDGVAYTVFPPQKNHYARDERNNASLLVHLSYGEYTFWFMADARTARLKEFLALSPDRCDFLKVPHHGHYQKGLPVLFRTLSPRYAVITSSDEKKEDSQTLEALYIAGCQTVLTRKGTAVFISDGQELLLFQ